MSQALDGATVYGHQAAGSSYHFFLKNSHTGTFLDDYSQEPDNMSRVGYYSVTQSRSQTQIRRVTQKHIRISNNGNITEGPQNYDIMKKRMPWIMRVIKSLKKSSNP